MPWFEVVGDRFDWMPSPRRMVSYMPGRPHFGTRQCVRTGVEQGVVVEIERPNGWSVGKDGVVRRDE